MIAACCEVNVCKALIMEASHASETSLKWLGTTVHSHRYDRLVSSISCQFADVTNICTPSPCSILHCFVFISFPFYVRFVSSFHSTLLAASSGHRPFVYFRFRRRSAHPSIVRRSQHLPWVARGWVPRSGPRGGGKLRRNASAQTVPPTWQ
jgi:hypothetical protein